jgi:hypothetical protein
LPQQQAFTSGILEFAEAGARTASHDSRLVQELKQYTIQQGINPLEVD